MNNGNSNNILEGLNSVQREAVETLSGPMLIVAGAGSGKTRVLTSRIANLIEHGTPPFRILALTFTKKAANEMKSRIATMIGPNRARYVRMGTFHSVFASFLRKYADLLGFKSDFTIYDTANTKSVLKGVLKSLQLEESTYKLNVVASRISMAKNNLVTPAAYASNAITLTEDREMRMPRLHEVYSRYAEECKKSSAMDFDDILLYTNILLRDHPDAAADLASHFDQICVDEYQDTNYAQYIIVKRLALPHRNICVVGDDSQSIYAFRGARIENILKFKKDWPEAKVLKLEQNYRSTQNIVLAANSVIQKNHGRIDKECFSQGEKGDRVHLISASSEQSEALLIASSIKETIGRKGAAYKDFAILYRTNAQSRALEEALINQRIPHRILSGTSFFDRTEVKDMLAYFRLAVNPLDNEAFLRIINLPKRNLGGTTIDRLKVLAGSRNLSLMDAIALDDNSLMGADIKSGAIKALRSFREMMLGFTSGIPATDADIIARQIEERVGLMAFFSSSADPTDKERAANIDQLLTDVAEYCRNPDEGDAEINGYDAETGEISATPVQTTLVDYLAHCTLLSNMEMMEEGEKDGGDINNTVSLMTVHSSKGLEFPYVYIAGMEENIFPGHDADLAGEIEEERRLFYVALTRAMKGVSVSFAYKRMRYGKTENNNVSRFLREISPELLDGILPRAGLLDSDSDRDEGWGNPWQSRVSSRSQQDGYRASHQPAGRPAERQSSTPYGSKTYSSQQRQAPARPGSALSRPSSVPYGSNYTPRPGSQSSPSSPVNSADHVKISDISVGTKVRHQNFGSGTVLECIDFHDVSNAKVVVDFPAAGKKTLLFKFAKLTLA
ncbi:MAG: UvrD-helicase domain-containing protein [Bacteroidales bacterium]|nr:UvrD-helicase domain-containing protein [Bacteroidales bacterium]